jgi:hypothetical protein
MTGEATAENFEHEVEVVELAGSVDDGEGAEAEGGVDVAEVVAVAAGAFDDDGGRGSGLACEEFEEAWPAFFGLGAGVVDGQAEVDDGDVDGSGGDDGVGFASGACAMGDDAEGFEEAWEVIDPGVGLPAGVGEEEVESSAEVGWGGGVSGWGAAAGVAAEGRGVVMAVMVGAYRNHARRTAKGVPDGVGGVRVEVASGAAWRGVDC